MTTLSLLLLSIASATGQSETVVLDFSATSCEPCQQMSPIVARLQRQGYDIRTVDIDDNPDLARKFRIRSIPAFVRLVNGREETRVVGATTGCPGQARDCC